MIVYDMQDEKILAFSKGADEAIFNKAKYGQENIQTMEKDCTDFASEGQRTLVYGYKEL